MRDVVDSRASIEQFNPRTTVVPWLISCPHHPTPMNDLDWSDLIHSTTPTAPDPWIVNATGRDASLTGDDLWHVPGTLVPSRSPQWVRIARRAKLVRGEA